MRQHLTAALAAYDFTQPIWQQFTINGEPIAHIARRDGFHQMTDARFAELYDAVVQWHYESQFIHQYAKLVYHVAKMRTHQKDYKLLGGQTYQRSADKAEHTVDKLLLLLNKNAPALQHADTG